MSNFNNANCMGYALNQNRWLVLGYSYRDGPEELERRFPYLKPVRRQDMVLGKEYIAYRYGWYDFHYVKRGKKGHWRHKCGAWPIEVVSEKTVFGKYWDFDNGILYNSKIYLFEVQ